MEAKAAAYGSEDESSSEEEDDGYIPDKTEAQIFETLMKIRRKDKSIYDKEAKFYSSDDGEDDNEDGEGEGGKKKKVKKEKPMYLKDVVYKEAMDRAAGLATDSDEEEGNGGGGNGGVKTYNEEQEDLKNSFLQAFETEVEPQGDDDFGGVLKARRKAARAAAAAAEEEDGNAGDGGGEEGRVQELLDAYFTSEGKKEMNENDKFLRSFILKKGWVDHEDDASDSDGDGDHHHNILGGGGDIDDEEDEAAFEAAQAFEANYNFRYEEPGSGQLVTHPRQIEGTVRKEDDRRKKNRAEKAARKLAEEEERRAEVRRLKNLKKAEIEGRLHELQTVAGAAAPKEELLDDLLAGDFDPEAHDRAMAAAFGDDYYGEGDESEEDIEQDELFAKELAAMAKYDEADEEDDDNNNPTTFAALQKRLKQEEEEERQNGTSAGATAARSDIKRLLEEYHKLDYEDHVGGIPTRFRYKEVQPETYGLSIEEILMMDDKELNQVVGLKTVAAPYREEYKKVRPNYGALNEWRKEKEVERYEKQNRKYKRDSEKGSGRKKDRKDGGGDGGGDSDGERREGSKPVKATAEERRLASFQIPTIKKKRDREDGGDKQMHSKKNKSYSGEQQQQHRQQQQQQAAASGLSKAQRKNMKRAAKRAAKSVSGKDDA
jgi:protein KRI1